MPQRPLRPCSHRGCAALTTTGRCAAHPYRDTRPSASQRNYGAPWRAIRAAVMARDPLCTIRTHCTGAPSTDAAHIVSRHNGGSDLPSNLRGACHACHSAETCRNDGGFGNPMQPHALGATG